VLSSTNVAIPIFSEYNGFGSTSSPSVYASNDGGPPVSIPGTDRCSLFQEGTFDASPFPSCGDRVCDGAETVKSCPEDCGAHGAMDAGMVTDGGRRDAGVDAKADGSSSLDGTSPGVGEAPSGPRSEGCACRTQSSRVRGEPGSLVLGLGLAGLFRARRRRRQTESKREGKVDRHATDLWSSRPLGMREDVGFRPIFSGLPTA
jgi:hypothetical protein